MGLLQFVQECLSSKEESPPVVLGGAVQGLLTGKARNVAGVSLFAAHMPGWSTSMQPIHLDRSACFSTLVPMGMHPDWLKPLRRCSILSKPVVAFSFNTLARVIQV